MAKATLDELLEDIRDWLKANGQPEWDVEDPRTAAAREFARKHESWEECRAPVVGRAVPGEPHASLKRLALPLQATKQKRSNALIGQW